MIWGFWGERGVLGTYVSNDDDDDVPWGWITSCLYSSLLHSMIPEQFIITCVEDRWGWFTWWMIKLTLNSYPHSMFFCCYHHDWSDGGWAGDSRSERTICREIFNSIFSPLLSVKIITAAPDGHDFSFAHVSSYMQTIIIMTYKIAPKTIIINIIIVMMIILKKENMRTHQDDHRHLRKWCSSRVFRSLWWWFWHISSFSLLMMIRGEWEKEGTWHSFIRILLQLDPHYGTSRMKKDQK